MWLFLLAQVVLLDLVLSGDNAVVVAGAVNSLPKSLRDHALFAGIGLALLARIALVSVAGLLIHIKLLSVAGGLLLFWIAYRMVESASTPYDAAKKRMGLDDTVRTSGFGPITSALVAIVVADLTMSLDNIAAIAGLTKGHPVAMVFGLLVSVAVLGLGAKVVSGFLEKHSWLNWVGAALVTWVGLTMVI